jgi:4-carboxymuconolactone decarboxylase
MAYYLNLALDNGVKPSEISEIITHLAFYSGCENAMSAVVIAKEVFHKRGIAPNSFRRLRSSFSP